MKKNTECSISLQQLDEHRALDHARQAEGANQHFHSDRHLADKGKRSSRTEIEWCNKRWERPHCYNVLHYRFPEYVSCHPIYQYTHDRNVHQLYLNSSDKKKKGARAWKAFPFS